MAALVEWDRVELAAMAQAHPTAWAIYLSLYAGDGTWTNARHFDFLAERLLRMRDEADRVRAGAAPSMEPGALRLCVSMPPGSGKSEYLSLACASWWLGTRPDDRVVIASYSRGLAVDWGKRARDAMATIGPEVFGIAADPRQRADWWVPRSPSSSKAAHGFFYSVGRGGALTGKRAELLVIDDLLKDALEAESPAIRKHAWQWLDKVALTRLLPWSAVIQIGTRWHVEDPIGLLESRQEEGKFSLPWEFVNLPALCEGNDDPLGREPGESLWPAMWSSERLEQIKQGTDPSTWAALFQGRPTLEGGNMFDPAWLVPFDIGAETVTAAGREPQHLDRLVRFATVDLAYTTKMRSDYTVICVWGADLERGDLYLLHLERDRIGAQDLATRIKLTFEAWGVRMGYLEKSGFYADIVKQLRKNVPLKLIQPNTDKVARAQPAIAFCAGGGLLVRRNAPWLRALKEELEQFPEVAHDDQVDALAYGVHAFLAMRKRGKGRARYKKKGKT